MASELIKVCQVSEIPEGEGFKIDIDGFPSLAAYRIGDDVYVSDDLCTHGEASLSEGELEEFLIICPFHEGSFDVRTGKPVAAPCTQPIKVYETVVENDDVFIRP